MPGKYLTDESSGHGRKPPSPWVPSPSVVGGGRPGEIPPRASSLEVAASVLRRAAPPASGAGEKGLDRFCCCPWTFFGERPVTTQGVAAK